MSLTPVDRRVITFYSFKGGVGRTMLLANVAYRMANKHGLRVIAVDWDLEAPGLHRFFGISSEAAAKADGVLDYFVGWREAVQKRAPKPPDVSSSIIPITHKEHAPRFGSLSLLTAGRMDDSYDRRLASLDWQDFYANSGGASAVETLREQLVGQADVVLIDSRTGFTDAGGICTIQIPDGVVLVTAPNQQSLEGIDRIARAIAGASRESRSGRGKPRMWFIASRVPLVEETYLADQWFVANEPRFEAGRRDGLWLSEDHPEGLRSHSIPHRGRWGFNEVVLNEAAKADPNDPLSAPYDRFAEILLRWLRGEPPLGLDTARGASQTKVGIGDIKSLEAEVEDAERRGDIHGMAAGLIYLAMGLVLAGRPDESIRKLEQASGIFLSRGSRRGYIRSLDTLGWALSEAERYEEASQMLMKALELYDREMNDPKFRVMLLQRLADVNFRRGLHDEARQKAVEAYEGLRSLDEELLNPSLVFLVGASLLKSGELWFAVELLRKAMLVARSNSDASLEVMSVRWLIKCYEAGQSLEDIDQLRARLSELTLADSQPTSKSA